MNIKAWLLRRRVRRAAKVMRKIDAMMIKYGMSREVRRAYWREIAKDSSAREALLGRMEK